jgi:uncharacterized membrane protein HdeD (DUF308 family)
MRTLRARTGTLLAALVGQSWKEITVQSSEPNPSLKREVVGGIATELGRSWWTLLLRGIAAIVFSIRSFTSPGLSLATLVLFFGAYALVDGAFGAVTAVRARHDRDLLLLGGLVGIGVGVLTLFYSPAITAVALTWVIAAYAAGLGVVLVALSFRVRSFARRFGGGPQHPRPA